MPNAVLVAQDFLGRAELFEDRRQALVFGGRVQASKVKALLATSPHPSHEFSVNVFADEFVVDDDLNDVSSATILAQKVIISGARSWHWTKAEGKFGFNALDLVCSQIDGGPLNFAVGSPAKLWSVDGIEPRATRITIKTGMRSGNSVSHAEDDIIELTGHPSFGPYLSGAFLRAANMLGRVGNTELEEAIVLFRWVQQMTKIAIRGNRASVSDMSDLSIQSRAMLDIAVNKVAGRPPFVPGMNLDFYHGRLDELTKIIEAYESSLERSEIKDQVQKNQAELAGYLKLKASNDIDTLKRRLADTQSEIDGLGRLLEQQQLDYVIRSNDVERAKDRLEFALVMKATLEAMSTILEITAAVVSIGAVVGPAFSAGKKASGIVSEAHKVVNLANDDIEVAADALADARKIVKNNTSKLAHSVSSGLMAAIKKLEDTEDGLAKLATGLKDLFSASLKMKSISEITSVKLPEDYTDSLLQIQETDIAWTEMEDNIQRGIEHELEEVPEARVYRDTVKYQFMLARALVGTQVSMIERGAEVLEIARQIEAAEASQDNLEALIASAESIMEREELVQGHYVRRIVAMKRAVLVCAERFRATYVYRTLATAPLAIDFSMSAADMESAVSKISQRIGETAGEGGPGQDTLVECTVPIELRDLDAPGNEAGDEAPPEVIKSNTATGFKTPSGTYLTLSLSPDELPEGWDMPTRATAYFVREARFFLLDTGGDADGAMALRVTASGPVENLCKRAANTDAPVFSMPGHAMPFSFKRLSDRAAAVADRAFLVGDDYFQVTSPWAIEAGLVFRSPFSVWSLEIPADVEILPTTRLAVQFDAKRIEVK